MGEFVRSFLSQYDRKASPLYLAGEDWGTGRVAGLAGYLNDHNVPVRGVALLSITETADSLAGDTQYITLLPSLVMSAWHHKKLAPELNAMSSEQIAGEARKFASREYLHALYKGDRLTADERAKAIADLSRLTGLGKQFLISNDLRVTLDRFNGELLKEQHRGLSASDARVSGFVPPVQPAGRGGGGFGFGAPPPPIDFQLSSLGASFAAAYEAYVRKELTFTGAANAIYYLNGGGVGTFTSTGNDDAALASAFARNPNLRLFVAVNYFDLNAPFFATEYTLAHLNVAPEVRAKNIAVTHLEAGGMPYLDAKALGKLHQGLAEFVSAR
jgi:carboxypeptidase C (cathepsin A)